MSVYENEVMEALDSMKKVLDKIDEKLEDDDVLGDVKEVDRLKIKKIWVTEKINEWEGFINQ